MKTRKKNSLKPPRLGSRLQRAFRYAAEKHAGQTRKQSAVPYLSHLMAVASLVLEAGGDEDMAIAALLHDVVEDCGGMPRLHEIRRQFGPQVAKIVEGCTDSFGEPKPEWVERKKDYLREVKHADAETRLVSASDKLHNVRTILADYRQHGEDHLDAVHGKKRRYALVLSRLERRISAAQPEPHYARTRDCSRGIGAGGGQETAVIEEFTKEFDERVREEESRRQFREMNDAPNA